MTSLLQRVLRVLIKPTRYRGRDLEGNKFYEYPSSTDDPRRTKRMIEYKPASRKWDYVSGRARLPVQWSMWLTHTRPEPPTLAELQTDLTRQQRVQQSVLMLEEQYEVERKEQKLLPEAPKPTGGEATSSGKLDALEESRSKAMPNDETIEKRKRMMAPPSTPPPETQSWTPRSVQRG